MLSAFDIINMNYNLLEKNIWGKDILSEGIDRECYGRVYPLLKRGYII